MTFFALRSKAGAEARAIRPQLESLEDRLTPAVTNADFVSGAIQTLLHRNFNASNSLDSTLLANLNAGTNSRLQVTTTIETSDEGINTNITDLYRSLLLREPDASAFTYYGNAMRTGTTLQQSKALIMASAEYYGTGGSATSEGDGTNLGWLDAVYSDQLGRVADTVAQNYWLPQLTAAAALGADPQLVRQVVAQEIVLSAEGSTKEAQVLYDGLLNRAIDSAGVAFWPPLLGSQAGNAGLVNIPILDEVTCRAIMVSSDEFFFRG